MSAKFDVNGAQNVEVSVKVPCEKSLEEQLEIMEAYTQAHRLHADSPKELREAACLRVLYPRMFRKIEDGDLIAGRLDFLPIGFGCVTSLGGVGHYCVFNKLLAFKEQLPLPEQRERVDRLYDYWLDHDLKTEYCREVLTEDTLGRFIDVHYPMIATARLSGMMLDYPKLLDNGIGGLREQVRKKMSAEPENAFYQAVLECFDIFAGCAQALRDKALEQSEEADSTRKQELLRIAGDLEHIKENKPETFPQAMQLFWLYAMLAGVINYGRLDDYLGPYLVQDYKSGRLTEDEAYRYVKCLWTMIENRRTTVNGRVIVGGKGRRHPKEADAFLHLALKVAKECRYVEPQFTLRVAEDTPEDVWDEAMDALGAGATYPTLYNDEVNVPAVAYGMRLDEQTAEQYVPFGCTEFVIQGQSTGTPNVCMNLLKMLTLYMNGGVDPADGIRKNRDIPCKPLEEYRSFEEFYEGYKRLLDYYMDLSIDAQMASYRAMNRRVSFLFTSVLVDDCLERGKALLDGGVRYLGGTNEIYGLINASDGMATDLYEYVAKGVRQRGIDAGMQYYLVVISNNQLNTEWGRETGASPDGRYAGQFMNPANNPQGGANKSGPTAMLNSLAKIDTRYHAGSVQNIKFSPSFFQENREAIKSLFKTYFARGGSHVMVTVVGRGVLEDAVKHPENYKDLIVRVSGFSAVFVNLEADIQQELMSRVLYD